MERMSGWVNRKIGVESLIIKWCRGRHHGRTWGFDLGARERKIPNVYIASATHSQYLRTRIMPTATTLCQLAPGASAVIEDIPVGHDEHITRLRELGLVPGTRVRLVRRAPLGDPIEISVRGSRLAMRRSEAQHIKILPQ
jgi:ferrous iron transport protein A